MSFFFLIIDDQKEKIRNNLLMYAGLLDISLICDFFINQTFRQTHILGNVLINCCVIIILGFICLEYIIKATNKNTIFDLICTLHIFMMAFIIFLSGSRAVLILCSETLIYILTLSIIKNKNSIKYVLSIILCICICLTLYFKNFGDAQFTMDKQIYTISNIVNRISNNNKADSDKQKNNKQVIPQDLSVNTQSKLPNQPVKEFEKQKSTEKASDNMRADLINMGISEIKKNFFFGTGNLKYEYKLGERVYLQTAQNFILESLIAFGFIGTVILISWVFVLFKKVFMCTNINFWSKINALLVCLILFAFAYKQEMLYSFIIASVVLSVISNILAIEHE